MLVTMFECEEAAELTRALHRVCAEMKMCKVYGNTTIPKGLLVLFPGQKVPGKCHAVNILEVKYQENWLEETRNAIIRWWYLVVRGLAFDPAVEIQSTETLKVSEQKFTRSDLSGPLPSIVAEYRTRNNMILN